MLAATGTLQQAAAATAVLPAAWRRRQHQHRRSTAVSAAEQQAAEPEGSLVPHTLEQLELDAELQALHARAAAVGQAALTREEEARRRRSLASLGAPPFPQVLSAAGCAPLVRGPADIMQLNVGLYCNQACRHCHVESSPKRTEMMDRRVAERCVQLMAASQHALSAVDLTGGAPELTPQFRYLVGEAAALGLQVIDRCNLTVLLEPGQEDLVEFLAAHRVRVVASLPCYSAENVDAQRGGGVFRRSIRGLQLLNAAGYGRPGTGLVLDLVYNPGGVFLAPPQATLEPAYKQELEQGYGVVFNSLLCLNNMPIKRWVDQLVKEGRLDEYMRLLVDSFNPAAAAGLMCRDTVSVGWDGRLYDCDFNQQLELGLVAGSSGAAPARTVFDIESLDELTGQPIAVGSHCFGCTAGAGSGCQGATS